MPVVIVAEWVEDLAVLTLKLGAMDYVVKLKASFRSLLFRLNRLIASATVKTLEAKLPEAGVYAASLGEIIDARDARLAERDAAFGAEREREATSQQRLAREVDEARAIARQATERAVAATAEQDALRELLVAAEAELDGVIERHATALRETGSHRRRAERTPRRDRRRR